MFSNSGHVQEGDFGYAPSKKGILATHPQDQKPMIIMNDSHLGLPKEENGGGSAGP